MSISEKRIYNNKLKRRRELQKHLLLGVIACCLVIICSLSANIIMSAAHSKNNETITYKYYRSIEVQAGDTLNTIATAYAYEDTAVSESYEINRESYINEIMSINGMSDDQIIAGQYLIVPYYSNTFVG